MDDWHLCLRQTSKPFEGASQGKETPECRVDVGDGPTISHERSQEQTSTERCADGHAPGGWRLLNCEGATLKEKGPEEPETGSRSAPRPNSRSATAGYAEPEHRVTEEHRVIAGLGYAWVVEENGKERAEPDQPEMDGERAPRPYSRSHEEGPDQPEMGSQIASRPYSRFGERGLEQPGMGSRSAPRPYTKPAMPAYSGPEHGAAAGLQSDWVVFEKRGSINRKRVDAVHLGRIRDPRRRSTLRLGKVCRQASGTAGS